MSKRKLYIGMYYGTGNEWPVVASFDKTKLEEAKDKGTGFKDGWPVSFISEVELL